MSIDVHAKNVKLWKNEHESRKGTFYTYSVSVSKKLKDGSYKNKGMKVIYSQGIPSEVQNGATCDIDGFLTLDVWEGRNGEVVTPALYAKEIKFHDFEPQNYEEDYGDNFAQAEEDIPF